MSAAAETSKPVADSPWVLAALTAIMLGAVVATTILNPQGLVVSRDPGYEALPVPLLLVPAVAVIVLTLVLPRGRGSSAMTVRLPSALRSETAGLLALAVGFPLIGAVMPRPEDWVLLKAVMFLIVPGTVLVALGRRRGPSVRSPIRWSPQGSSCCRPCCWAFPRMSAPSPRALRPRGRRWRSC